MVCWLTAAVAYYPATHAVRTMVEDENFCADVVRVLGAAAGVHPAESFYDPALPDNASDRAGAAGPTLL